MFETESVALEITSERKLVFYRNKSDTSIRLDANERLFILPGTLVCHLDDAYTWIEGNELYYLNVKQFKLNVPVPPLNHYILLISATQLVISGTAVENVNTEATVVLQVSKAS